jgi:hypothetical protein
MRTYKIIPMMIGVACIFFTSCEKSDVSRTETDPPVALDSNYLYKSYDIVSSNIQHDTTSTTEYIYDELNRLTSMDVTGTNQAVLTQRFFYNGNDPLPAKFILTGGNTTHTIYFSYDQNNKLVKDSSAIQTVFFGLPAYSVIIHKYVYAPGKIYAGTFEDHQQVGSSSPYTERYTDTATYDSNNNLVKSQRKALDYMNNVLLLADADFTYDHHHNPFAKLNIFPVMIGLPDSETDLFYTLFYGPENVTNQHELGQYGQVYSMNATYTYNAAGYPLSVTNVNSDPYQITTLFEYKPR